MVNIKGITIQLEGDATGLTKALKQVDGETKKVQSELKQVDRLLKFDPTNIELLSQKQQLLGDAINSTTTRLDALKQAQGEVERQFANGEIGADQYRAFQREIAATEGKLKAFIAQADAVDVKIDAQADTTAIDKMKDKLGEVADVAKDVGGKIGDGLKKGATIGAAAIAGIGTAAAGAVVGVSAFVESQKEMSMDMARLKTNADQAGMSMDKVNEAWTKVSAVSGEADSAVEAVSNLLATGMNDNQLAQALDYVNGAAIKFSDTLKTEGIADGLQETFASGKAIGPFAELLERSGVNLEVFDAGLAKAQKSGEGMDYILQQLSQLGLKETYDSYMQNNQAIADYNLAQAESQRKLAEFSDLLRPFVTTLMEMGNIILDVVLGNKSLAEGFSELVEILQGLSEKFLSAAKDSMPSFIKGIQDALPQVLEAGVKILTKIVEGIASKYPTLLSTGLEVINKLGTTLINNLPKLLDAGVKLLTSVISGITSNLPKLVSTALNLVLKLASTIVSNLPKIIEAGVKILTSIVSGIAKALPDLVTYLVNTFIPKLFKTITSADWKQIGTDIINGLIKGIKDMTESAVEAITGVVDSVTNAAKKLLGIKSPSRVFAQIGEWTVEGFTKGLESTKNAPSKIIEEIGKSVVAATKSYNDELVAINQDINRILIAQVGTYRNAIVSANLTEKQELEELERKYADRGINDERQYQQEKTEIVRKWANERAIATEWENKITAGVEKQYADKILSIKQIAHVESYNALKESLDKARNANEISALEEMLIWKQAAESFAESTHQKTQAIAHMKDLQIKAYEEMKRKTQELRDHEVKMTAEITAEYTKAVDERAKSISSFAGIFDEFKVQTEKSGADLMANLQSQVDGFKSWQTSITELSSKAINEGLLAELKALGPKAAAELAALNAMTDEELAAYSALYEEKQALARQQAEVELIGMKEDAEKRIKELSDSTKVELDALNNLWKESTSGIVSETDNELSKLTQVGVNAGQGLLNGLASMQSAIVAKATDIAQGVKDAMTSALDIHSPSRVMQGFGVNIGQGLVEGMDEMVSKVASASARLAESVSNSYVTNSSTIDKSRSYSSGDTIIYVQGNNLSPSEIARKHKQAQRQLALEWGV